MKTLQMHILKLGIASNTKEEEMKCYNEAIRIYNKCNIENKTTARAYFNIGNY